MNINLELTREDVGTLVTALGWMAEDLGILQRAGEDDSTRTDDAIGIGDRVKVKEQDIRGLVVRFDCGRLVVLDDARNEWADDDEEGVLVFSASEVEREWSSRQATDLSVEAEIQSVRDLCAHLYEKLEESHVEDE
ncbi:hypothetical protein CMI48_04965 [Candidatus Pacearchaeota archaeon]|jgi:hypothetical protein|nr:hypothetical protein [Candidatus Pacearchaeota archaeon]